MPDRQKDDDTHCILTSNLLSRSWLVMTWVTAVSLIPWIMASCPSVAYRVTTATHIPLLPQLFQNHQIQTAAFLQILQFLSSDLKTHTVLSHLRTRKHTNLRTHNVAKSNT